jgi:hypothetical protein
VSGFDLSGAMIELARARCGEGADLIVHDLADPLPYADGCRASGRTVVYTTWHRPLQPMGDEFTAAGFRISVISEPDPAGRTRPTAR